MTFEELLNQLAEDYLNPPILPDGKKDADRNGHTRLLYLLAYAKTFREIVRIAAKFP